jgi:large subunit ribosomal protein L6
VPDGVTVQIQGESISVKGPKGELSRKIPASQVKVVSNEDNNELRIETLAETQEAGRMAGTTRALVANMVTGVKDGFSKTLDISGAGFGVKLEGRKLVLSVGYADDREVAVPDGLTVNCPSPTRIVVSGCDREAVGTYAAKVRDVRPPEPYKGKGIKYETEQVRRKAGKAFVGGAK